MKKQRSLYCVNRRALLVMLALLASSLFGARPVLADDTVLGHWWTPGFASRVEIFRCPRGLCGKLVWLWDSRAVRVGQVVLSGFHKQQADKWTGGSAFNPADGNTYRAALSMLDNSRLLVSGCVLVFCREQIWLRVGTVVIVPVGVDKRTSRPSEDNE